MSVEVRLTPFELLSAAYVGVSRQVSAIRDTRQLENGRTDNAWATHIEGAIAEYAVACYLDACWRPTVTRPDTNDGDLANGVQVKSTSRADGSLIVRPHDPSAAIYVLVVSRFEVMTLCGWLEGTDAKADRYWRELDKARGIHRAAYFVPQADLQPIESLEAVVLLRG